MAEDVVVPIVFPDYLIHVNTPATRIEIPDLIPGFDLFPDAVPIPSTRNKVPELGHAGVLFIRGRSGITKYYEYGRYDAAALGLTRRVPMPDVEVKGDGFGDASFAACMAKISRAAGRRGRISGAYIPVPGQYEAMLSYAKKRVLENSNPNRPPYELLSNSCVHFMKSVVEAAGVETPTMIDPRPNSYIEELRSEFTKLDYKLGDRNVTIGG
jgi:hypothetical protein